MKFKGHNVPEYFTATFYVLDNDGVKVTKQNLASFKDTWTVETLIRITKAETADIVQINVLGSKPYKGHLVVSFPPKQFNPNEYGSLQARHFNQVQEYRTRFISVAVQVAIQSHKYKKLANGGHSWTLNDHVEVSTAELERINKEVRESSYTKLDGTFYETFAKRYRELVLGGDKSPIKSLQNLYYPEKTIKHVQTYATTCRKKGLLPPASSGRNSNIKKTIKRKGNK
jgi:hypothetical protein